jgi:hypothetical protein
MSYQPERGAAGTQAQPPLPEEQKAPRATPSIWDSNMVPTTKSSFTPSAPAFVPQQQQQQQQQQSDVFYQAQTAQEMIQVPTKYDTPHEAA